MLDHLARQKAMHRIPTLLKTKALGAIPSIGLSHEVDVDGESRPCLNLHLKREIIDETTMGICFDLRSHAVQILPLGRCLSLV